jgi:hypothetical protein
MVVANGGQDGGIGRERDGGEDVTVAEVAPDKLGGEVRCIGVRAASLG